MNKKIISGVLVLLLVGLAGWKGLPLLLPPEVTAVSPVIGPAVEAIYATGTVEPTIMVPIAPRSTARITMMNTDEGQDVKKGDILAQLEDTDLQASIAELQSRFDFADKDMARKESLWKSKAIAEDAFDSAKTLRDAAKAQLDAAKAKATYLQLVAPADGKIIQRDGEVGQTINAGVPVFMFSCCAPLRITAEVDEENIARVKTGQDVLIQSDNFKGQVFHGKITAITPKGDPVSRSYRVRISFDDPNTPFLIGMTTELNIVIAQNDSATLLPLTALGPQNTLQKIVDDHVELVTVGVGSKGNENVEITGGITPSDRFVSSFLPHLAQGDKVRVTLPPPDTKKP